MTRADAIAETLHGALIFDRRTRVLSSWLSKMVPTGASVLDVGCGDGSVAALILADRPDISIRGIDVLVRAETRIPVDLFDGTRLPFAEKSVDVVTFVDVLHHTEDPGILLKDAKRVARQAVLLKDHTMDGVLAYHTLRFMDWVGNASHGVALPYNYWPERRWRSAFAALGLRISRWEPKLGLYPFPASLVFERGLHFIAALEPV